jgi:hypothetical protein
MTFLSHLSSEEEAIMVSDSEKNLTDHDGFIF